MSNVPTNARWPKTRRDVSLGIGIPFSQPDVGSEFPRYAESLAMAEAAAAAGIEVLWVADHFSFPSDDGLKGAWEVWTLMAALAAKVPHVQIGPMVACTAYRNPGVIAKMAEMIDEISGGRFILGLGAGWQKDEYDQFGLPFEPRVSRFEEALKIIHGLLRTGQSDVQGTYYQTHNAQNLPRGPRVEGAPILVGSSGPRMLGLLAEYGDAWDTGWDGDTPALQTKVEKFEAAMTKAGRDPQTVARSASAGFAMEGFSGDPATLFQGSTEEKVAFMNSLAEMGFAHIRVSLQPLSLETIAAFAPVLEAFYAQR